MKIIVVTCVMLVAYTYALYPLTIAMFARFRSRPRAPSNELPRSQSLPHVSVILCAKNEATNISPRLRNLLSQDYDANKMEIVIVSDGSSDGTMQEIESFVQENSSQDSHPRFVVIDKPQSAGKAAGLNDAVSRSTGEILIMADARQLFGQDDSDVMTIRRLVSALSDAAVGCVSGELRFVDETTGGLQANIGLYWKYEKWIRRNEATIDSVPGVTGAIYAMKRFLYEPIPAETLLDDVLIPLRAILRGYRVTFDDQSVARDTVSTHPQQEWKRKVRTLAGNWQLINLAPSAFMPIRNRIWFQFISHKVLRLIVPFALIACFLATAMVPAHEYRIFLLLQTLFYGCAAAALVIPGWKEVRVLGFAYTFVMLNLAAVAGFWHWFSGQSRRTWVR